MTQADEAGALENVPGGQGTQLDAPAGANEPAGHVRHVVLLLAPVALENVPIGHSEQLAKAVLKDEGDIAWPMTVHVPKATPPLPMTNGKALYVPLGHCKGAVMPVKGQ